MPTYQYACTECGQPHEAVQSFSDPALTECPACHGRLRKVFNSVGVVFKGSGFYRNDSRAGASTGSGSAEGTATGESAGDKAKTKEPAAKSDSAGSSSDSTSSSTSSTPASPSSPSKTTKAAATS